MASSSESASLPASVDDGARLRASVAGGEQAAPSPVSSQASSNSLLGSGYGSEDAAADGSPSPPSRYRHDPLASPVSDDDNGHDDCDDDDRDDDDDVFASADEWDDPLSGEDDMDDDDPSVLLHLRSRELQELSERYDVTMRSEVSEFLDRVASIDGLKDLLLPGRRGRRRVRSLVRDQVGAKSQRLKQMVRDRRSRLSTHLRKPPVVRLLDKLTFTWGVLFMLATMVVALKYPWSVPQWYAGWTVMLLGLRFSMYHNLKFHYFMLDFCYFVQAVLLFYIVFYPNSSLLFRLVFSCSNGPLVFGIPIWRNSLVFHDLDKITSLYIHLLPPVVTYIMRWYPADPSEMSSVCAHPSCIASVWEMTAMPVCFYLFWQLSYYLKVEVVDREKLADDESLQTSRRWMTNRPNSAFSKLTLAFGPRWAVFAFMGYQLVYIMITMFPVALWFNNFVAHTSFLAIMLTVAVWNGANYYFDAFARQYAKRIERKQNEYERRRAEALLTRGSSASRSTKHAAEPASGSVQQHRQPRPCPGFLPG